MASSHDGISSDGHDDHCSSSDNDDDNNNNEDIIKRAANVLNEADYLLILAGAGFSSDSGLDTYETMPIKYQELCNPIHLASGDGKTKDFHQFWIDFAIKYKNCQPHEGYTILNNWLGGGDNNGSDDGGGGGGDGDDSVDHDEGDNYQSSTKRRLVTVLPRIKDWYVYTSNVDGHFRLFDKFNNNRICEIHGYAGEFRCSNSIGYEHHSTGKQPRHGSIWSKWNEHVASNSNCSNKCNTTTIDISSTTSSIVDETTASTDNDTTNDDDKLLRCCQYCGLVMRPNVLMFHDTDINVLQSINCQRNLYQKWEANIEDCITSEGSNKNFVILEFGCGLNVPAVRIESEEVLHDCLNKINNNNNNVNDNNDNESSSSSSSSVTLIRINPKDAGIDNIDLQHHTISIYDTSLNALRAIDKMLQKSIR